MSPKRDRRGPLSWAAVTVTGVFAAIVEHDRRKPRHQQPSDRLFLRGYREWHSRRRELTRHALERKMTTS